MADEQRDGHRDRGVAVVRRAPFAGSREVGVRGQQTQQRILDAAVRAFGEHGYHACTVDRITKLARCSRIAFYQYFASKEAVFGQLAEQVSRQVSASTDMVDPITADQPGWDALRAWVARYAEVHARYEPVFHAYESDAALAVVAEQTGEQTLAKIRSRLATTTLPARQLDTVVRLLLEVVNHTLDVAGVLRSADPSRYDRPTVERAITHVIHRTLFGLQPGTNSVLAGVVGPGAPITHARTEREPLWTADVRVPDGPVAQALLDAGRQVFVERGYHRTRVADVVAAAGLSHGVFYRYFRNKHELARVLTGRAVQVVGTVVADLPEREPRALRRWLQRYHVAHSDDAAMLRVWLDAALQDPTLRADSAPLHDWGRRRMAHYLAPRGFGDHELEAVVLVALLGVFGARPRPSAELDATALIIERGLLGD